MAKRIKLGLGQIVRVVKKDEADYDFGAETEMIELMARHKYTGKIMEIDSDGDIRVKFGMGRGSDDYLFSRREILSAKGRVRPLTVKEFCEMQEDSICDDWMRTLKRGKTWKQAFQNVMTTHEGMGQACDWIQENTSSRSKCLCGQPYAVWMDAIENMLGVKVAR